MGGLSETPVEGKTAGNSPNMIMYAQTWNIKKRRPKNKHILIPDQTIESFDFWMLNGNPTPYNFYTPISICEPRKLPS